MSAPWHPSSREINLANCVLDSLVSSHVYEIIRTIYQNPSGDASDESRRVPVLQQTLSQLRLTNIATLDACMNHFTRLIELTSADETYVASLATMLAPCVLRPRIESSLTMEEKHAYRLVRDLFAHKDAIFSELKRLSALTHSSSTNQGKRALAPSGDITAGNNRPRAISTDESNRKAHMEERTRALLEKANGGRSRATSPAPSPRAGTHRRDRSVGGPETRFPIQTSPTSSTERHRQSIGPILGVKRSSLEVPGGATDANGDASAPAANGSHEGAAADALPSSPAEKRSSLNRNSVRFVAGRRITTGGAASVGSGTGTTPAASNGADSPNRRYSQHAVTLVDRPMDD